MRLFKNKDVIIALAVFSSASALATVAAFAMYLPCGFLMLGVSVVFIAIYLFFTRMRYNELAQLSQDIDKMLHNDNSISLNKYSEGELSILYSELYKLTVTLREQGTQLQKEKRYLADSIADISHQIKTPLTSINLIVILLTKPDITEERRTELVKELYRLASHIDRLIAALLKLSQLDAGTITLKKENITLRGLADKACEPLLVALELHGVSLDISADGSFCGDIAWTSEAIGNIVKNCMEHCEEGGRITVTAAENALFSEIIISDNGCGISEDDLPHIFERFYHGKNAGTTSVGIGLALAKMIVVSQNGTMSADNNRDKGARFTMRFYKSVV